MGPFKSPWIPNGRISCIRMEIKMSAWTLFSKKSLHAFTGVSHSVNSKCAAKFKPWRVKNFAKRASPTSLGGREGLKQSWMLRWAYLRSSSWDRNLYLSIHERLLSFPSTQTRGTCTFCKLFDVPGIKFPVHFELTLCDTLMSSWRLFLKIEFLRRFWSQFGWPR